MGSVLSYQNKLAEMEQSAAPVATSLPIKDQRYSLSDGPGSGAAGPGRYNVRGSGGWDAPGHAGAAKVQLLRGL